MKYNIHVSLHRFLIYLCDGWRLPFIVQPMIGNHGNYAITLERCDNPAPKPEQGAML